jgi:transposase
LYADETQVRQLGPGRGRTRNTSLWTYRFSVRETGPVIVVFDYQTSLVGAHARVFLQGWRGRLMVDDYAGYQALFTGDSTERACLEHIRRKLFDVHAVNRCWP